MQIGYDTALRAYAHLMLEHVPVGMALFDARELRLLAANPCYQSLLEPAWQNGRAIGRPLTEFLPRAQQTGVVALFRQVAQTGVACRAEASPTSVLERGVTYWSWTLDPIGEQGQVDYLLLTATEVTSEVVAHQHAEQRHAALDQTHQEVGM